MFEELADYRAFELLRSHSARSDYLLTKQVIWIFKHSAMVPLSRRLSSAGCPLPVKMPGTYGNPNGGTVQSSAGGRCSAGIPDWHMTALIRWTTTVLLSCFV